MANQPYNAYNAINSGIANLGLTLNTPSNNQQSAQRPEMLGGITQAGSNNNAYYAIQKGLQNGGLKIDGVLGDKTVNNPQQNSVSQTVGTSRAPITTEESAIQAGFKGLQDAINAGAVENNKLIDEAYGASAGYLNQAEDYLRSDYPTVLQEIENQRLAGVRTADSGKASTLGTINEQQILADQRNQNVMADARRLYDELTRGYQQRFGGASSAGLAASELAAVERQRQQGKIQQDYGNTVRQIESARTQVESKYQDQLFQLEESKKSALIEAERDFKNKLLQITQARAENEQAKAQARLSALQDLRNKVYQINLQNLQFQQTLAAQKAQADQGLQAYASQLSDSLSGASSAAGAFNPEVSSGLISTASTGGTTNPYVGAISKKDELVGSIIPNRRLDFSA